MNEISLAISEAIKNLFDIDVTVVLTRPDPKFGDFTTNVALQLAGSVGKNPHEIAQAIVQALQIAGVVAEASVAGPGFINIRRSDESFQQIITDISTNENYGASSVLQGKEFVIETNNPNPFKDIHIGHAFNSIVADTIANLLQAGGATVHRVSYHGDVGLHVGKSLWAIYEELGDQAEEKLPAIPESERPKKLRDWYARGAGMYEEEPTPTGQIEDYAKQSFAPQGSVQAVYETTKTWSFVYFDSVFERLGCKPIERRYLESEADKAGRAIVEAHIPDVFEHSDEAVIFKGEKYDLHTRVFINRRGNTLYEARDLGLLQLKATDYPNAVQSIIMTAEEQKQYFQVIFKVAELAVPELAGKTVNLSTGTVKLSTGKMSSRTGNVVTIEWLFETLGQVVAARGATPESVVSTTRAALRYTMLKNRYTSDTILDIESSISLEGNTGPYLQYAHARASSIVQKAKLNTQENSYSIDQSERELVSKLDHYPEVVIESVKALMPHVVCTYLFELTQIFNSFYEKNRVLGDAREPQRLLLLAAYLRVLKNGLNLLGIDAPESM